MPEKKYILTEQELNLMQRKNCPPDSENCDKYDEHKEHWAEWKKAHEHKHQHMFVFDDPLKPKLCPECEKRTDQEKRQDVINDLNDKIPYAQRAIKYTNDSTPVSFYLESSVVDYVLKLKGGE